MSKTRINRGMVHVVPNEHGSIYEMDEDMNMVVTLCQIACWFEDNELVVDVREVKWPTDFSGLRINSCVPGNIYQTVTTDAPTEDPECCLWWAQVGQDRANKVMRDEQDRALYRTVWYDISSTYQISSELKQIAI